MAQPVANPYENDDTKLWTLERRVHKTEMALDSIDHRLDTIEESVRELRSAVFNQSLFFGILIIVVSALL